MSTVTKTRLRQIAKSIRVSDHSDYGSYLLAIFSQAKIEDDSYSYVKFSADLGLSSANAHSTIRGKRPLTEKMTERICQALHITGVEKRYFLALVSQSRAKNTAQRDEAFQKRIELKSRVLPNELSRQQLEFFNQWYHAAILELLRIDSAQDDPEWIADTLIPKISVNEATESLKLLKKLGYVALDKKKKRLTPTEARITTGNEVWGLAIASFHRQMLGLASVAIDECRPELRDLGAVTIALPLEKIQEIKDELSAFRKKILELSESYENADTITQINLQMFPLAKLERKKS